MLRLRRRHRPGYARSRDRDAHPGTVVVSPPPEFVAQANVGDDAYREAERDRLAFWAKQAGRLSWAAPFEQVLDWSQAPFARWFVGGKLNVAYNCVDRHVEAGHGDRVAIFGKASRSGRAAP